MSESASIMEESLPSENAIDDSQEPTLENVGKTLFHRSLHMSSERSKKKKPNAPDSNEPDGNDDFNEEGSILMILAAVEVFAKKDVATWGNIAADCNDTVSVISGRSSASSAGPTFRQIHSQMVSMKAKAVVDLDSNSNCQNATFPPDSWFKGGRGIESWLKKGKEVANRTKGSNKAFPDAAEDFKKGFSGFILQLYYAKEGPTYPDEIQQNVGELVYQAGCEAAKSGKFPWLKYQLILGCPSNKGYKFAIVPGAQDPSGLTKRLKIGGYSYNHDVAGYNQLLQPCLNAMTSISDHLLPGDSLEKQRSLIREKLESEREALIESEAQTEAIKLKIEELQCAESNLSKQIDVEITNRGVVEKLRTTLSVNNEDFEEITTGVCDVVKDIANSVGNIENPELRKKLLVNEVAKLRTQYSQNPIPSASQMSQEQGNGKQPSVVVLVELDGENCEDGNDFENGEEQNVYENDEEQDDEYDEDDEYDPPNPEENNDKEPEAKKPRITRSQAARKGKSSDYFTTSQT